MHLKIGWNKVIRRSGLGERVKQKEQIDGTVAKIKRPYKLSAVIGNGKPEGVFQRVVASSAVSVNAAAFSFEAVKYEYHWGNDRCASFVFDSHRQDPETRAAIEQWSALSTIMNVAHPRRAVETIKSMPLTGMGH